MRQTLTNFTAGEVTSKLDGRFDISKYFNAAKTLFNMIVWPYGPATRRAGTKFVYETKNSASKSRLIPFKFTTNYMIEFGDKYARFFEAGGVPISTQGPVGWDSYYIYESDFSTTTKGVDGFSDYSNSSPTHARIGRYAGAALSPDILDEGCTDISGWTDNDWGSAVSEVDPIGQFRFDTKLLVPSYASRYKTLVAPPNQFTIETKTYFDALGAIGDTNNFDMNYTNGSWCFRVVFASDGLFIEKVGGAYTEASVNIVKCNATAAWQTWRFEVDKSGGENAATVTVYLDGVNQGTALCNYITSASPYRFYLRQYGWTIANMITHVDYIKVGTGIGTIGNPSALGLYSDNAAYYAHGSKRLDVLANSYFFTSIYNSDASAIQAVIGSTLHGSNLTATKTINAATWTTWNFNNASAVGTGQREIYLELSSNNVATVEIEQVKISRYATEPYEIDTTINEASLPFLKYAQREDTTFFVSSERNMPPGELIRYDHDDWTFDNITFTKNPFNGATTAGYPGTVTFFEQRSLWGNTLGNPQTIWGSVTGVYRDLDIGLADDDAFSYSLDAEDYCPIFFIAPTKYLTIGTGGGIFKASSDAYTEPLTPTNIFIRRTEKTAAADIMPQIVGTASLFMEEHNRMLGQAKYDAADDSIAVIDMALLSEHLMNENMNGSTIVELAFQKTPDNILWGRQENGNLLGFTYNPKEEVYSWHRHETEGSVESIACIPGFNYDELWMIVKRTIDGMLFPDIFVENFNDLSLWTNSDTGTSVSEISPIGQLRLDTNLGAAGNATSSRYIILRSPPSQFTIEIKTYFDALGTYANTDYSILQYSTATWLLNIRFCSDGLFIMKAGAAVTEVGTDIVKCNASAAWQTWRFQVDKSAGESSATVEVFLDGISQGTVDCDYETTLTNGKLNIEHRGYTTDNMVTHVDYIKIANGFGPIGGGRYIEVMKSPEFPAVEDCWFLDSAVLYNGSSATIITGLDHLNGATVGVFADGTVFNNKLVNAGSIVIESAATKVLAGLKFTSRIQSMRAEIQTQKGTSQGRLKRIFRVIARVFKTASFKAGYDWDNMDVITTRTLTDPLGSPVELTTDDIEILPFRGDWDKGGYICIEQSDPVPLTVSALIADIKVDE